MKHTLHHGAAFYPELWPQATIDADIAAIKALGLTVVRMGEFAWAQMEPNEGQIDLSFFVSVMDRLHDAGIATVFCTPTPTPPIWVTDQHPERLFVDEHGRRMIHGARQHICTNNPDFRRLSRRITEAIARAVGQHPGLVAWQTDNEFKCHVGECYCSECRTQWHAWLQQRYGTIDALNEAWGTAIWSQRYQRFDQVVQPAKTAMTHNASLTTAYRRFSHEKIAEFQREQVEIIRQHSSAPITHNSMVHFNVDLDLLFRDLDCGGFDHYAAATNYREFLMQVDIFRTLKPGRGFWVMESSPSHSGQILDIGHPAHPAKFVEASAVAAYALGAAGFSYWLWRQQRTGCELPHGALLSAWGKPTSAGYDAAVAVENARRAIEPLILASTLVPAQVALTYSDRARSMWLTEPLPLGPKKIPTVNYVERMTVWHDIVRQAGFPRDLCAESAPLDSYTLLITSFAPNLTDDFLTRALAWVEAGGTWIVGPMTHWRTSEHTVHTDAALGALEKAAGVNVAGTYSLWDVPTTGEAFGMKCPLGAWSSFMTPAGAQSIGRVTEGRSQGLEFLTEHTRGKGRIILLGAWPEGDEGKALLTQLIQRYAHASGVDQPFETSPDVVVALRRDEKGSFVLAINLGATAGYISFPHPTSDLITGKKVAAGRHALEPYEWRALRRYATE